ncbi:MAG: ABC transporter ATP-binding protein [Acutalibacteraceae bacterium]|jgi:energy-coupling factor transporter ATP-binding protein EcfA2
MVGRKGVVAVAAVSVTGLSFWYPASQTPALRDVSLEVEPGETVLLIGATGSGKTTLLRSLKPEAAPVGTRQGRVRVGDPDAPLSAGQIGYVAQHPDNQLVMDSVWHELAFGLENQGLPSPVIRRRMAETVTFFGMGDWMDKKVYELSGGQKQLLNLAAVMVMQPSVLLMDEPTAQLDPIAAREFWQMVVRIRDELGVTVIVSEHNGEEIVPLCDKMVWLKEGAVAAQGDPGTVLDALFAADDSLQNALPAAARLARRMGKTPPLPLTVRQGRQWLATRPPLTASRASAPPVGEEVLRAKGLWFRYDRQQPFAVKDVSLSIGAGEIHALMGGNGSGKTTLLHLLAGVDKPQRGSVKRTADKRIGLLGQDPRALFVGETLLEDWREGLPVGGATDEAIERWAIRFSLWDKRNRHPMDLSGGEQQKAALIKVLLRRPDVLLLDEPTKGMDAAARQDLAELLREWKAAGKSVVLSTHDLPFAACLADRCTLLLGGEIVVIEPARTFFTSNLFYTTPLYRLTRGAGEGIVVWEDLE